jgi:hypothetical protein
MHPLTWALDGYEWSASRLGYFTRGTHWIGEWVVGFRSRLVAMSKRKIPSHRSSDRPARRQSLYRLSYPGSHLSDAFRIHNIGDISLPLFFKFAL